MKVPAAWTAADTGLAEGSLTTTGGRSICCAMIFMATGATPFDRVGNDGLRWLFRRWPVPARRPAAGSPALRGVRHPRRRACGSPRNHDAGIHPGPRITPLFKLRPSSGRGPARRMQPGGDDDRQPAQNRHRSRIAKEVFGEYRDPRWRCFQPCGPVVRLTRWIWMCGIFLEGDDQDA